MKTACMQRSAIDALSLASKAAALSAALLVVERRAGCSLKTPSPLLNPSTCWVPCSRTCRISVRRSFCALRFPLHSTVTTRYGRMWSMVFRSCLNRPWHETNTSFR